VSLPYRGDTFDTDTSGRGERCHYSGTPVRLALEPSYRVASNITGRLVPDSAQGVDATLWTQRFLRDCLVWSEKVSIGGHVGGGLLHFKGPDSLGAFDSLQIVDACLIGVMPSGHTRFRNKHRCKQDDRERDSNGANLALAHSIETLFVGKGFGQRVYWFCKNAAVSRGWDPGSSRGNRKGGVPGVSLPWPL
jgi:hypothetical protein